MGRRALFLTVLGLCLSDLSLSTLLAGSVTEFSLFLADFQNLLSNPTGVSCDLWLVCVVRCLVFVGVCVSLRLKILSTRTAYHRVKPACAVLALVIVVLLVAKLVAVVCVEWSHPIWHVIALSSTSLPFCCLEWWCVNSLLNRLCRRTITHEGGRHYEYLPLIDEHGEASKQVSEEVSDSFLASSAAAGASCDIIDLESGGGGGGSRHHTGSTPPPPTALTNPVESPYHSLSSRTKERGVDGVLSASALKAQMRRRAAAAKKRKKKMDKEKEDNTGKFSSAAFSRMVALAKPDWAYLTVAFVFLVVAALAQVAIPLYTGQVIDYVAISTATPEFIRSIVMLSAASLVCAIGTALRGSYFTLAMSRYNIRIRNLLFQSLLSQDIGFFDETSTGDITSRLSADTTKVSDQVSLNVNVFLRSVVQVVGVLVFMCYISWKLTLVTFAVVPLVMIASKVYGKYYKKVQTEVQTALASANDVAEECISGMRTVKSFANMDDELLRYKDEMHISYLLTKKQAWAYAGYAFSFSLLPNLVTVVVLFYGGHLVITGELTGGALVSFVFYQMSLSAAINTIGDVWTGLMSAFGAAEKVFEWIDRTPKLVESGTLAPSDFRGEIEFRHVSLVYPSRPETQVLNDVSFTVKPGEVVALVGPSGGGKSSCISLLERFYDPTSGEIYLDGQPLRAYNTKFLHSQMVLVGQEPVLFARSLHENIAYALPDATDEQVITAATRANAHLFVSQMEEGYETSAGEKGQQLSGGQKQRIAISRALVRNPTILLLDEATSALDAESEHLVQQAIEESMQGRTVIIIAHRLSTVKCADRIVVIERGRVVEQGSHDALLADQGLYYRLVRRQLQQMAEVPSE